MSDGTKKTILVVDDEADVRNFLKLALVEAGFEVITAEDGNEALEVVKKSIPDLISLDLVMPKKSGAMFHRELNKNPEWVKIPIIIGVSVISTNLIPDKKRRTKRTTGISRCGLYPDILEGAFSEYFTITHAVQCHPPSQA